MDILQIRELQKTKKITATVNLRGLNDFYCIEGIPVSVEIKPPTSAWVINNKTLTSSITRYAKLKTELLSASKALKTQPDLFANEDERAASIQETIRTGIEYFNQIGLATLQDLAQTCYYLLPDSEGNLDEYPVKVVVSTSEIPQAEQRFPSSFVISFDLLTPEDIMELCTPFVGIEAEIAQQVDIPIEVEGGETSLVPASDVAAFPRNIR